MNALVRTIETRTRIPITNEAELTEVLSAARELRLLYGDKFQSPWDVAKLLSSCLRCALAAAATSTAGPSLRPLLNAGLEACPVPSVQVLAGGADAALCHWHADEARKDLRASESTDTSGASVLLSLLHLWHRLLPPPTDRQAAASLPDWLAFSRSLHDSTRVLWVDCPLSAQRLFHDQWLQRMLSVAAATEDSAAARSVCECAVGAIESCNSPLPVNVDTQKLVVSVQGRLLGDVCALLLGRRKRLEAGWAATVAPVLQRAVQSEPAPLTELFFLPVSLTAEDCASLAAVAAVEPVGCLCPGVVETLRLLRGLRRCTGTEESPVTAVVARAKAAALAMMQEWELPAAAELLGMWEPQLSPVDGAWLARVRGYCRRSAGRGGGAQEEEKAWSRVWDYSAAITFAHPPLLGVLESECAAVSESVLDVLVLSTRPERLRVCVDLLLRQQQPSIRGPVAELLENPVTAPLLLAALDKLVRALLDAGDVPLARSYLCSLAQCLLVCPSTAALAAYLSLLRRTAQALVTVSGLSPFLQQQREELRGRWSTIARSLAPWDRGPSPAATSLFAQRRTMFHRLCSSSSSEPTPPPPSSPPAVTRVAIRARGGCITVHRECRSPAQDPYTAMLSLPDDAWVSEALDSMGSILLENKAQLGSGSGAVIERPRSAAVAAAEEAGGSPACGEETSTSSDGKVLWWSRRFALDEEIRAVAKAMQRALGPASLLLLGDVDFSLWQGLWSLSEAAVAAEDAALFDPGGSEGRLQLVQILSVLLQGLPFLAPLCNGFSPRLGRYSQKARYTPPTAPYNSAHGCGGDEEGCCPTCSALVSGTVASLEGVLAAELQKVTVQSGPGAVAECARRLSSRLVPSTFKLLYDSLASGSSAREGHVDLLAVPRGHVCLELDHRLQALPWEGLDVLRTLSSSRVPVGGCRNTLRAPVSFARALLYREGALPAAMQALLDAQSGWELVDAGDDDRASPPDGESPLCTRLFKERAGLYVYMGHRGGEQLLARRQLYDRVPSDTFPAVLLMGCSSARLTGSDAAGWCGSYGLPLAYLHAGAPAAVGCMWDVTDGDIDKTTLKLLEWCVRGGTGTGAAATMTLGAALAKARTSCRLPYLTGVATVLFSGSACPLFGHSSFGHRNDVT